MSVPVEDLSDHISKAHDSDSVVWTSRGVSNASPPVTGAAYWNWEDDEEKLTDD